VGRDGAGGAGGAREGEEVLEPVADVNVDREKSDKHGRVRVGRSGPEQI